MELTYCVLAGGDGIHADMFRSQFHAHGLGEEKVDYVEMWSEVVLGLCQYSASAGILTREAEESVSSVLAVGGKV